MEGGVRVAAKQQWNAGLHRFRLKSDGIEVEEFAVMLDDLFCSEALAHVERLLGASSATTKVKFERAPLFGQPSHADPEVNASARECRAWRRPAR